MLDELRIGPEAWEEFWREAEPLMRQHHEELGPNGIVFDLDHRTVLRGEACGGIRFWTARRNSRLIGYITWYINPHPYSKGLVVAAMGPWYVAPSERTRGAVGARLMIGSLKRLYACGIRFAYPHHPPCAEGIARWLRRRGAVALDIDYILPLGKEFA